MLVSNFFYLFKLFMLFVIMGNSKKVKERMGMFYVLGGWVDGFDWCFM